VQLDLFFCTAFRLCSIIGSDETFAGKSTSLTPSKHQRDWIDAESEAQFPLLRISYKIFTCSEWLLSADFVEKQRVAGAESQTLNTAQVSFSLGFPQLLRCRKDLG
jgi:hypothetical protein